MGRNYIQGWLFENGFVYRNLTYEDLLSKVHEIICDDLNSCVYEMKSLLNIVDTIASFKIKNDRHVQFVLGEEIGIPEIYVTVQHSQ